MVHVKKMSHENSDVYDTKISLLFYTYTGFPNVELSTEIDPHRPI